MREPAAGLRVLLPYMLGLHTLTVPHLFQTPGPFQGHSSVQQLSRSGWFIALPRQSPELYRSTFASLNKQSPLGLCFNR